MTNRWAAAAAAISLSLLTACGGGEDSGRSADGGTSTTTPSPAEPTTSEPAPTSVVSEPADEQSGDTYEVTDVGFSLTGSGDLQFAHPVAIIKNNGDEIASITVSFAAYDAAGSVIGQTETSAPVIRAGATVATTTVLELETDAEVDSVDARVSVLMSQADENPESAFVPSDVNVRAKQFGHSVTGKVESRYQDSVTNVYVAAVCWGPDDTITAGGETYVDIPSGDTVPVEVDLFAPENYAPARCELFPTLGGASDSGNS